MKEKILKKLHEIETDHKVTIILACESGSRAWGFPSKDSDYDVRFIYLHTRDWYLSVGKKRDVIELPIKGLLDINGWDIKKALLLLQKSNPALLEWLNSPIIYQKQVTLLAPFLELSRKAFLPESSCHHYLSMAKSGMDGYRNAKKAKLKKYLYSIRPLLCCQWVIEYSNQPPMLFNELVEKYIPAGDIKRTIDDLLATKKNSNESDLVERNPILEGFISSEYDRLDRCIPKNPKKQAIELFDQTFRNTLELAAKYG